MQCACEWKGSLSPKVAQVLSVAMTQADRAVYSVQVWWQTIRYPQLLRMPRFETLSQSGGTQKEKTPLQNKSIVGLGHESVAVPQYYSDHKLTTDSIPCVQSHTRFMSQIAGEDIYPVHETSRSLLWCGTYQRRCLRRPQGHDSRSSR